jgi:hypothetical protein
VEFEEAFAAVQDAGAIRAEGDLLAGVLRQFLDREGGSVVDVLVDLRLHRNCHRLALKFLKGPFASFVSPSRPCTD